MAVLQERMNAAPATWLNINVGKVPHPSRSFRPQRMSAPRYSGVNPPIALGMAIGSCSHQDFAPTRTTTPPSGVSVRFDSGRARFNCGATYFRQATEKTNIFECVSIWVKGGWKETRGVQRPISAKIPVSESRIAQLNPFESKRKKAHAGASSRVREWFVAEEVGFEPTVRSHARRFSRPVHSTTLPLLRRDPPRAALSIRQTAFLRPIRAITSLGIVAD